MAIGYISQVTLPDNNKYNVSPPFIVGTGSSAGTWLGELDGLTEYYDGLMIIYKPSVAGGSKTTTLNLNSIGAKTCYLNNTTKLTTHFPKNQPIILIYSADMNSGCWMASDYDYNSNTNTLQRTYRSDSNVELPIAGINASNSTAATYVPASSIASGSYGDMYGAIPNTTANLATINPSTGHITVPGGITAKLIGDADTVSGHSVSANIPSTAVFTDTWIPLSTTQGGYVSAAAPDDNKKFLRGDATWATLPAASSTVAGITKIGASGGAAAYSHGEHVTTATVKEALGTSTTHNNQFLRKDGTWQTVNTDAGVTSIGTLTGDITTSELITELKLSTAMHFRGIATTAVTEGSKDDPTISGYTFGINGASALAGDVILDKDSQYEYVWTKDGNTGSWELLGSSESYSLSNHTHGNLTNDGKITTTATIANGDKLVIVDSDNTAKSKITGSSITFDGSTTSNALTQAGTWETFNNYTHPTGDGNSHVPATGTTNQGLYLKAGATADSASWEEPPVWWGTCETKAATVNKEVNDCPGFVLKNGAVIFVWFKYTNSGGISSITLNVQGTGAKHIKYLSNTSDPGNIPDKADIRANQTYMFRYSDNGTNQYWVIDLPQDTNDGLNYLRHYTIKAQTAITAGHILGGTDNGYNNIDNGSAFDIRYAVLYCAANLTANQTGYKNYVFHYAINIKNSSNSNIAFTAWKNIYIKGTINGNIFTPISGGNPYVQDITAADDGYVYYYIGRSYNTSAMTFDATSKAIYWYKDGAIRPYNHFAARSKAAALTTTANDVAYYTDTNGTFGSISSADGALYSTTANGTLQWGTLPTGQGGTGKTSWTQWGIVYASATDALAQVTAGAASNSGLALISNGAAAPEWYGGLSLTGTAAASWKANFLGTTDASSTTAAAVTITGGLGVAKTLYVGTQAIIAKIKIGNGTSDVQQRTITVTEDNNLIFDAPSGRGFIFQQNATTKIRIVGYTCYPEASTGSSLGITGNRWETAYLTTSLLVGANSTGVDYNTNGLISFIGPGVISSCIVTENTSGYYLIGSGVQYGRWFIEHFGRNGDGTNYGDEGKAVLEVGNETPCVKTLNEGAHNGRGVIRIHGANRYHTDIVAQANNNRTCYLPYYGGPMYLVHAGNNNAIGNGKKPVYVAGNGRVTVCNTDVGDPYIPMYAKAGEFTMTSPVQYKSFTIASGQTSVTLESSAYNQNLGIDVFVLAIVITSGEEYLNAPITWSTQQKANSTTIGQVILSTSIATSNDVTGYILTAHGSEAPSDSSE